MDLFRALIQSIGDPAVQIDDNGILLVVNSACCSLFQYQEDELLGKNLKILLPETFTENHGAYVENCSSKDNAEDNDKKVKGKRRVRGQKKDGTAFSLSYDLSHAEVDGKRVYTAIMHDTSAEEEIRDRMLSILNSSTDLIIQIDSNGVLQHINKTCCNTFGYEASDLVGQNLKMLVCEDDATNFDNYFQTGAPKSTGAGTKLRVRRSDGSIFPIFLTLSQAKVGNDVCYTGIMKDMSREEQELELMRSMICSSIDPIVQINSNGIIKMVNPACCTSFQYEENELLGKNVSFLMPEPHGKKHDGYITNYLATGVRRVLASGRKLRGLRKDGTTFALSLTISEAKVGGTTYFTGTMRDTSAEEQWRERMLSIIESAVDPIVQMDTKGVIKMVNPACCTVFKYEKEELVGRNVKILMPEEHAVNHDSYIENYRTTGVKKVMGTGRKLRGKRSDGTTFPLFLTLSESEVGGEIFFTGILRDMTAEEQERQRMESMIFAAVDPIVQINSKGIIKIVNPACCKAFMYEEHELVGNNVSMLMSTPHNYQHDQYIKNYMDTGVKKLLGKGRKMLARRKNGKLFTIFLAVSEATIGDEVFFTGILRDLNSIHLTSSSY